MPDLGPHQFDIPVSDSYPANNPADPSDDLKVSVEVQAPGPSNVLCLHTKAAKAPI